jgi:hypothetical protein
MFIKLYWVFHNAMINKSSSQQSFGKLIPYEIRAHLYKLLFSVPLFNQIYIFSFLKTYIFAPYFIYH